MLIGISLICVTSRANLTYMKYFQVNFNISAPAEQLQDARDLLAAYSGEAGFETFDETATGLVGYIQQCLFDKTLLDNVLIEFPMDDVHISYTVSETDDKDWNEVWETEGFEPIVVDNKITIHDGRHLPAKDTTLMIEIDAKMAFGTGTHETTRMIVSVLMHTDMIDKNILDCGCGTGILGICAIKAGAAHVVGYDIDEWSVDNARHNAVINHVGDSYVSLLGDARVIASLTEQFDIVVANINRNILLCDMPSFVGAMKPNATLVLSGFYRHDIDILLDKATDLGLYLVESMSDNDWACMVLQLK